MDWVDIGIYASYVLIGVCALAAVALPLIKTTGDTKGMIKGGIGVGAIIIVFFIGYAVASGSSEGTTYTTSKYVGAGIITTYVCFFGAIGGIVYTEIIKLFK